MQILFFGYQQVDQGQGYLNEHEQLYEDLSDDVKYVEHIGNCSVQLSQGGVKLKPCISMHTGMKI